jgi:hypothetical protein
MVEKIGFFILGWLALSHAIMGGWKKWEEMSNFFNAKIESFSKKFRIWSF